MKLRFPRIPLRTYSVLSLAAALVSTTFGQDLALNKSATASSQESATYAASMAVDGNATTRWSSAFSDPQWLQIDLGSSQSITGVTLVWEAASAKNYTIDVSDNGTTWTSIATRTNLPAGARTDALTGLSGSGRYVRMNGTARTSAYGYSLFTFSVFGGTVAPDLALNKSATASSQESATYAAGMTVDGNPATRWSSAFSDPQWLQIDLGSMQSITGVTLVWEAASAKNYTIDVSNDGTTWTSIATRTNQPAGARTDALTGLSGSGRYIRMNGTARTSAYGYSLFSFSVYGSSIVQPGTFAFAAAATTAAENGGNVTLTVNRTSGAQGAVTVNYATANGTALAGSDYSARSGTLSFADGVTSQTLTVPILDYATTESSETFTVALSSPTGGATIGTPATETVTILDNDQSGLALPGRIQTEDYRTGGEGSGYHDTTAGNTGGKYRTDDVDIEATTDAGGGYNVGWIDAGEWLAYNVTVATTGTYKLVARVASANTGTKTLAATLDGVNLTTISTTTAGGWQSWTDAASAPVTLTAGNHVLRLIANTGGFNINYVDVVSLIVANAGPDQSVNLGQTATLDGTQSSTSGNGQTLTYSWRQTGGATAVLINLNTLTPSFLPTAQGAYTFELTVSNGTSAPTDQVTINVLFKPSAAGPYAFDRIVYATPGNDYGALAVAPLTLSDGRTTNVTFAEYHLFSSTSYQTHAYDMSEFDWRGSTYFPFLQADGSNVPLNGILYKPSGNGPFPIVFFLHGNHDPLERSEPGYSALCEMLASQGFMSVTVDENYLNGDGGGNGARALLLLEHVKQFRIWNQTAGHPLYQKIDLNNIMLAGHSRGGEAVTHAAHFNLLSNAGVTQLYPHSDDPAHSTYFQPVKIDGTGQFGPYQFSLKAVVAIAPTTGQYSPVDITDNTKCVAPFFDDPYFLISAGRDSDVGNAAGIATYGISADPFISTSSAYGVGGVKGHLYLHNANHNFFNTVWTATPDGVGRDFRYSIAYTPDYQLSSQDQYAALKCFIGAVAQSALRGISGYQAFFKDRDLCAATLPANATTVSGNPLPIAFNTNFQDNRRLLIDHYEEDAVPSTASPLPGNLTGTNSANAGLAASETISAGWTTPWGDFLEHCLNATWNAKGPSYRTIFTGPLPTTASTGEPYTAVAVRLGFSSSDPKNNPTANQDFSLRLTDNAGKQYSIPASTLTTNVPALPKQTYITVGEQNYVQYPAVTQTLRFPLAGFGSKGVNTAALTSIELLFDRTSSGNVYIDDIQLTR